MHYKYVSIYIMLTYLYVSIYLSSKHLEVVLSLLSIYSLVLNPLERKKNQAYLSIS